MVGAIAASLVARAAEAQAAGITRERIAVDPGRGWAPATAATVLRGSGRLAALGYPVVVDLTGPAPAGSGDAAVDALAAACVGVALGCRLVRTAEPRPARRVADAVAAVLEAP